MMQDLVYTSEFANPVKRISFPFSHFKFIQQIIGLDFEIQNGIAIFKFSVLRCNCGAAIDKMYVLLELKSNNCFWLCAESV